jgi:hypothetical protein
MRATEEYYIACVKAAQVKAYNGSILTKEGTTLWLGESDGYPQLSTNKNWATKFKQAPKNIELSKYDGMPWYCRIKPDTLKVYKVSKEVVHTEKYIEQEVK